MKAMKKIVFVMSVMCCVLSGCGSNAVKGNIDTGDIDAGETETGNTDTGSVDTGSVDTGSVDTGSVDTGSVDTGSVDTGSVDTGDVDTGNIGTGVYIKTEADSIYSVEWSYGSQSGGYMEASSDALEMGVFTLLTEDISKEAEREGKPVDFTITAKKKNGEVFARGDFTYEKEEERMELTIMQDGTIQE